MKPGKPALWGLSRCFFQRPLKILKGVLKELKSRES